MWRAWRSSAVWKRSRLFLVGRAQILFGHLDRRRDVGQRELDVLEVDGLRRLIARLIVLVTRGDGGVVDRDVRCERRDVEQRVSDLAPLVVELDVAAELGRRQERGVDDAVSQIAAPRGSRAVTARTPSAYNPALASVAIAICSFENSPSTWNAAMSRMAASTRVADADSLARRRAASARAFANEVVDDGATQLATHVIRKLAAINRLILVLASL